jgi:hypothetical protein
VDNSLGTLLTGGFLIEGFSKPARNVVLMPLGARSLAATKL